jgi:hypothetical protein
MSACLRTIVTAASETADPSSPHFLAKVTQALDAFSRHGLMVTVAEAVPCPYSDRDSQGLIGLQWVSITGRAGRAR